MSVEGLWCFQSTSVQNPNEFQFGGVVVLETGRVLGGDSTYTYVGDFEVQGQHMTAHVHVRTWNNDVPAVNVFGMEGPLDYHVVVQGIRQANMILGHLTPTDMPNVQLPIKMLFIADLP